MRRSRRRRPVAACAAAVTALTLAACLPGAGGSESSSPSSSSDSSTPADEGEGGGTEESYLQDISEQTPSTRTHDPDTCAAVELTSDSGTDFSYESESIPAPTVGERAFAVRIAGDRTNTDRLHVRSGHNLVTVMQQTPENAPFDERLLAGHARDVLDDLSRS